MSSKVSWKTRAHSANLKAKSNKIAHFDPYQDLLPSLKYPDCGQGTDLNALPDVPYFVNGQVSATKGPQLHWRQESSINYTVNIVSYYDLHNAQHYSVSELEQNRKPPDLDYKAGRD